jgi:hypothetical protein
MPASTPALASATYRALVLCTMHSASAAAIVNLNVTLSLNLGLASATHQPLSSMRARVRMDILP